MKEQGLLVSGLHCTTLVNADLYFLYIVNNNNTKNRDLCIENTSRPGGHAENTSQHFKQQF